MNNFENIENFKCVTAQRASAILYNFIMSNHISGTVLMPANICECVPATYMKAGMKYIFCDIVLNTWEPDELQIINILKNNSDISVLHYNRTYGDSSNHDKFLDRVKNKFPNLIIIDDRCLSLPKLNETFSCGDLVLYSTGETKPVNIGYGAFGYVASGYQYRLFPLNGDYNLNNQLFDKSIKHCHQFHTAVDCQVMLSNWMNPAMVPGDNYFEMVVKELRNISYHKKEINDIYRLNQKIVDLSTRFPDYMQEWRFNILVANQQECMDGLFSNGLFASKHYMSLGNGYFDSVLTPNCDWLESHVINLFNDNKYTSEMAVRTTEILSKIAKGI